ncbi:PEGA domain-containing protein [Candidatus Saccharibacteria bacterium]|nr:PEGA domain-containing protein [Candidatus Saccharibacteria bacterium]
MDLEKQKRNQVIRVVITEILMVLAIIPIVILLTLLAMGYHLGEDMTLEQSGLVQVNSIPNGASVSVDGEEKFKTDASRMLTSGEHVIKISKDGYDSWSKKINVLPGFLLRVRYARLFKESREIQAVQKLDGLRMMSTSPNRTSILYQLNASPKLKLVNIRDDNVKDAELDLTNILRVGDNGEMLGKIEQTKWSWNGDTVLLKIVYDDASEWALVDIRDNASSRNLTKEFGLVISDIQFAGSSVERLYVLENNNLREINLDSNGVSRVLLSGVEEFYAEQTSVGYVRKQDDKKELGIYKNGDTGGIVIRTVENNLPVHVAANEYYGEKYLSYTIGDQLVVYMTEVWPTNEKEAKKMNVTIDAKIGIVPNSPLTINRTGEAILMRDDKEMVAVDLETNRHKKYPATSEGISFVDDYLLYGINDQTLTVWDFDGENQRPLANGVLNFSAVISANNRWLYYVAEKDNQIVLVREKLL